MKNKTPQIFPVIHHVDSRTTRNEAELAFQMGADGVFLISHYGDKPAYAGIADDETLMSLAKQLKAEHSNAAIGINCLSWSPVKTAKRAVLNGLDMVWADSMGVDSTGLSREGVEMRALAASNPDTLFFASVAFKYMPFEPDPVSAAMHARLAGFIPTTSGSATGEAPDVSKIAAMSEAGALAIASGMTPENVDLYAAYLSHILVATGISADEHHLDPQKLASFIKRVRSSF